MKRIGIRELQQHASYWVRRVQNGESFEVTDRGRLVALLVPAREGNVLDRLVERGAVRPPIRRIDLAPAVSGDGALDEALRALREEEDR
jgi:prevent-host-death family protein